MVKQILIILDEFINIGVLDGENSIFDKLASNIVQNVCVKSNKLFFSLLSF